METSAVTFVVEPGDPDEAQIARLLRMAEEYSQSLYPPESIHMLPVDELRDPLVRFLVARDPETGDVLGCGAIVLRSDHSAELKRMFVDPAARRRGVGARILGVLEHVARAEEVRVIRLETGTSQPEAVSLYHRSGYRDRDPFDDYVDDPLSIFMEKFLDTR